MRNIALAIVALAVLGACASEDAGSNELDPAFEAEYRANFMPSCVSAATAQGAPESVARTSCTCVLDDMIAELSQEELENITMQQSVAYAEKCMAKLGG